MLKLRQPSSPVTNVIAGQNAQLVLNPGPRYHAFKLTATVVKTAATSGFTSATLADALGLLNIKVGTVSKRQHTATELDAVQTAWDSKLAVAQYDGFDNNFNAVADVVGTINSVSTSTSRTTTFVLYVALAEPGRDSYTAREAFAWPTAWNNKAVGNFPANYSVKIAVDIAIPNNSTNGGTAITQYASGQTVFSSQAVRADEVIDFVSGPLAPDGTPLMLITHWYRQSESYTNTTPSLRSWPFVGLLQQQSYFMPQSSDAITIYEVLGDNVRKAKNTKNGNDQDNLKYGWNPSGLSATRLDLAFDYDDDPTNGLPTQNFGTFQVDLTLAAASAASKNIIILSQVWKNALAA